MPRKGLDPADQPYRVIRVPAALVPHVRAVSETRGYSPQQAYNAAILWWLRWVLPNEVGPELTTELASKVDWAPMPPAESAVTGLAI